MASIDLNPAGVSFEPNTYFKNHLDKIVKIKDCMNDVVVFDLNGEEKRLNRQTFGRFLGYFKYEPIDSSVIKSTTFSMIEMKKLIESNKTVKSILLIVEGPVPTSVRFVKIKSPMASHSAINGKKVEVISLDTVNFASGPKEFYTVKDQNGHTYEIEEQYIQKL